MVHMCIVTVTNAVMRFNLMKPTIKLNYLISNFRRVLNVVCFLLGNSPASVFYMPTFRNTLFHLHRHSTRTYLPMKMEQSVPKRRHIIFRRRRITQKKAYNKLNYICRSSL